MLLDQLCNCEISLRLELILTFVLNRTSLVLLFIHHHFNLRFLNNRFGDGLVLLIVQVLELAFA